MFSVPTAKRLVWSAISLPKLLLRYLRRIHTEWQYLKMADLAINDPDAYYSSEYYLEKCGGCEFLDPDEIPQKFLFAASLLDHDVADKRVLDFGCGRGEFAGYLHSHGAKVFGVDICLSALEIAKHRHPEVRFTQLTRGEVPREQFDLIFMMDLVEHLTRDDVHLLLPKLLHQLAPGGTIYIHTKDADQSCDPRVTPMHPKQITLFTARELAQAVTDAGMEVALLLSRPHEEEGYVGGLWCLGRRPESMRERTERRVMIEYESTVGDQLCFTPVIAEYRKRNPNDHLTIKVTHPELYINNPHVDEIVWCCRSAIARQYDSVYTIQLPVELDLRKMTLQNASARQLGFEIPVERHSPEMYLSDTGKRLWRNRFHRPKGLLVGIAPYSGWISREWPLNRWKVVTDYLIENHGAILVYLGKNDRPYPWLGFNMSGLTDLRELALLLEQCDLLLTVDNGIMHMAAAVGTPTVAIFGPVLAKYRCSGYHEFISIQSTNCVGCYHLPDWTIPPRVCPLKHHNCMTDITPMQVIDACVRQLSDLKDKPHDRK